MSTAPGNARLHCPRTSPTAGACDGRAGCVCARPRRKAPAVTATAALRDDIHPEMIVQVLLSIAAEQPGITPRRRVPRPRAA